MKKENKAATPTIATTNTLTTYEVFNDFHFYLHISIYKLLTFISILI